MKKILYISSILLLIFFLYDTSYELEKKYQVVKAIDLSKIAGKEWLVGIITKGLDENVYILLNKQLSNEYLILKFSPLLKYQGSFAVERNLLMKQNINKYFDPIDFCVDKNGVISLASQNYIVSFDKQRTLPSKYDIGPYFIERIACMGKGFLILGGPEEDFHFTPENEYIEKEVMHEFIEFVNGEVKHSIKIPLIRRRPPMGHMVVHDNKIYQISQRVKKLGSSFGGSGIVEPFDYYELSITSQTTGKTKNIKIPSKIKGDWSMVEDITVDTFNNNLLVSLQPRSGSSYLDILTFEGKQLGRIELNGLLISQLIGARDGSIIGIGYKRLKTGQSSDHSYLFQLGEKERSGQEKWVRKREGGQT